MNDHAEPVQKTPQKTPQKTASSSKIEAFETDIHQKKQIKLSLDTVLSTWKYFPQWYQCCVVRCQSHTLKLHECFDRKMGFASLLMIIKCKERKCKFKEEFYTSNPVKKTFDINHHIIYALRNIGQGHASIKKFTALMNMPSPMTW